MHWMEEALCKGSYLDFTAENMTDKHVELVKAVCDDCPVQKKCLDYAMTHKEETGVWGGQTVHERQGRNHRKYNIIRLDPEALRKDFETMTLYAITAKYKVSQQTIYRHIKENPWIREKKKK